MIGRDQPVHDRFHGRGFVGLKKYQPSGLTGLGGSPAKGDQGSWPEMVSPFARGGKDRYGRGRSQQAAAAQYMAHFFPKPPDFFSGWQQS